MPVTTSASGGAPVPHELTQSSTLVPLRRLLLEGYDGACAVTGCPVAETLQVMLVDPTAPAEPANALLLRADIACLFAAGLLSIDAVDLRVSLAPSLAGTIYADLAGSPLRVPVDPALRARRRLLGEHFRRFTLRHGDLSPDMPSLLGGPILAEAEQRPVPAEPLPAAESHPQEGERTRLVGTRLLQVKSLVNSVAFSPDGSLVATGSWDGVGRLWRVEDGCLIQTLHGDLGEINAVAFSPDGRLVAAAGRNQIVQVWRVADGQQHLTLRDGDGHRGAVFGLAFAPDGAALVSGSWDRTLKIWRTSDGALFRTLQEHRGAVNCVAVSPTGRIIASGSHDRLVRLWRVRDGTLLQTLQGHGDAVFSVAFSPDGRLLASAGTDQSIRVWRVADGSLLYALPVQRGAIFSVAFSPDGRLLASGDYGRAVRLWRVKDGASLSTGGGHGEGVTAVAFSPDGHALVSGSFDATTRFWDLGA